MKIDFHIHSKYSMDSFSEPRNIIKTIRRKRLNGAAIVDHNTIKGGVAVQKSNPYKDIEIVVGAEIRTEYGDVVGLFLNDEIRSRDFIEVIDEIKDQGGISVLAHPYRHSIGPPMSVVDNVDIIEGFNSRSKKNTNEKALSLARSLNMPVIAGSDAHLLFEIGSAVTLLPDNDIRKSIMNSEIMGQETPYYLTHGLSVMNEYTKKVLISLKIKKSFPSDM